MRTWLGYKWVYQFLIGICRGLFWNDYGSGVRNLRNQMRGFSSFIVFGCYWCVKLMSRIVFVLIFSWLWWQKWEWRVLVRGNSGCCKGQRQMADNEESEELIRYAALIHNSVMTSTSTEQWETSCHTLWMTPASWGQTGSPKWGKSMLKIHF
jgi:hypothetical protein